jgi:hypothetical protein
MAPIPITEGQTWEHLAFGVITILSVNLDSQSGPYYTAKKPDGSVIWVTPRRMELYMGHRFVKLLK